MPESKPDSESEDGFVCIKVHKEIAKEKIDPFVGKKKPFKSRAAYVQYLILSDKAPSNTIPPSS